MTTDPEITHKAGGWHEAIVTSRPSGHGSEREFRVRWRTQIKRCCGATRAVADGESVPVCDNQSRGLLPQPSQCRGCGSLDTPNWLSWVPVADLEPRPNPNAIGPRFEIRLPKEMYPKLDALAQRLNESRAATIRMLLDVALEGSSFSVREIQQGKIRELQAELRMTRDELIEAKRS